MSDAPPKPIRFGDLGSRLGSGLALAAVALVDVWMGGLWVALLVAFALLLMLWELHRMVTGDGRAAAPGMIVLACAGIAAVAVTHFWGLLAGCLPLAAGIAAIFVVVRPVGGWLGGGLAYMGLAMCYLIVLRQADPHGFWLLLWLVLVVVAADVGAYFVGRLVGGPKLAPRISPGKTWSGALGGLAVAVLIGVPLGVATENGFLVSLMLSLGIGIASQCGDLLESALKRRFAVKDASRLIPGHGGVMDRLDGVLGGAWFLAVCGMFGLGAVVH